MSYHIAVAGGMNLDLIARAEETIAPCDSNAAKVRQYFGGAGLNIARNLKLLGQDVALISAFSTDHTGQALKRYCQSQMFDLRATVDLEDYPSSTFVAMHHPDGDLAMAMFDMRMYDELKLDLIEQRSRVLQEMDGLVIEANLNEDLLRALTQDLNLPIVCDPVSTAKAARIQWLLPLISILKPNRYEAEMLTGQIIETPEDARAANHELIRRGVRISCLTLGEQGLVISDQEQTCYLRGSVLERLPASGAGDAMTAALMAGLLEQKTLPELGRLAMAAAVLTLAGEPPVNPEISLPELEKLGMDFELISLT